ncbi:MAG: alpha-L-fucosidase [Verrucomicrobiota bacterium]
MRFDSDSYFYKDTTGTVYPRLAETYAQIRKTQPECLISFCHGVTGDEDYITYEHQYHKQSEFKFVPAAVQRRLADKPVEITTTLQLQTKDGPGTKMWFHVDGAYRRTADEVWRILGVARRDHCNLLLNVAPRGDGSIDPAEIATLREVGRRLREHGFPVNTEKPRVAGEAEDR